MKIATFLPNWVGDAVMATPALRAVRSQFPEAEVVAIVRPPVGDVLAGTGLCDRTLVWNPRGKDTSHRGWRLLQTLRSEKFDLAVLFPNSLRSAWVAWCSGAKRRIGFARNGRSPLLTEALVPHSKHFPNPVIDEYLRLAEKLGCTQLSRKMEAATLPEDEAALQQVLRSLLPSSCRPESSPRSVSSLPSLTPDPRPPSYVALNPGGAFGAAKHWPASHFAKLARRIALDQGRAVVVLCGPGEREIARTIAKEAAHPSVVSFADSLLGIGLTKAAVRHAELLVTTDSGPRHFAPPFNVPVVTLFGPTHIAWSETYVRNAVHLQIPVDCGPCQQRICPLGHHRCMTDLSVEQVFAVVSAQLERRSQRPVIAA